MSGWDYADRRRGLCGDPSFSTPRTSPEGACSRCGKLKGASLYFRREYNVQKHLQEDVVVLHISLHCVLPKNSLQKQKPLQPGATDLQLTNVDSAQIRIRMGRNCGGYGTSANSPPNCAQLDGGRPGNCLHFPGWGSQQLCRNAPRGTNSVLGRGLYWHRLFIGGSGANVWQSAWINGAWIQLTLAANYEFGQL